MFKSKHVKEKWTSFQAYGWSGYVLKEKFNMIKGCLKIWHQNHTQNLEGRTQLVKDRMSFMDIKGEVQRIQAEEVEELHSLSADGFIQIAQ